MNSVWSWFGGLAGRLLDSFDDGSFFSRPWHWIFSLLAILTGVAAVLGGLILAIGGFVACFELCAHMNQHLGVQSAEAGILLALAQLATGLLLAWIWWGRRTDLDRHAGEDRVFISAPVVAHLVRTCGEVAGVSLAVGSVLFFLASWPFAGMASQILGNSKASFLLELVRMPINLPIRIPFLGMPSWSRELSVLLAPVTAYLIILITRWIAEWIEVFFAIANNTGAKQVQPLRANPQAPVPLNRLYLLLGLLCYLLLAVPLHQAYVLLPALGLLWFAYKKEWYLTSTLLIAMATTVLVRSLFEAVAAGDQQSVAYVFVDKSRKVHLFLFIVVLAAVVTSFLEAAQRIRTTLDRKQALSFGLGLALLLSLVPAIYTIADAKARHTLTDTERQQAEDLFKAYQGRPFAWRYGEHMDTTRTFMIEAPAIQADPYGMITVVHELPVDGRNMRTEFTCSYKAIQLPGNLVYEGANVQATVQYMNGDSIVLQQLPEGQRVIAEALDAIGRQHERNAQQRVQMFTNYRDSLNRIIDTLQGVFKSYDCTDATCFAWFDVERPEGQEKRSFYCPSATVSGYPVNALPKDGSSWTIVTRETVIGTEETMALGSGPSVYELIDLRPMIAGGPEPEKPNTPVATIPPEATPARTAPPKASQPKEKVFNTAEVDQEPSFPGGRSALRSYLASRQYPPEEKASGITGKVQVSFIVGRDGAVRDVRVERSPGYVHFDNEAKRIVQAMPTWTPGRKAAAPVDVRMVVTVDFSFNQ